MADYKISYGYINNRNGLIIDTSTCEIVIGIDCEYDDIAYIIDTLEISRVDTDDCKGVLLNCQTEMCITDGNIIIIIENYHSGNIKLKLSIEKYAFDIISALKNIIS